MWNPKQPVEVGSSPIIYRVFYIPGGAGFLPSTVLFEEFLTFQVVQESHSQTTVCDNGPVDFSRMKCSRGLKSKEFCIRTSSAARGGAGSFKKVMYI